MRGLVRVMVRVASMPLPPGMCRSITTTSGCSSAAIRTASGPFSASPTTSTPSACRRPFRPCRNTGWSSVMRTRMVSDIYARFLPTEGR